MEIDARFIYLFMQWIQFKGIDLGDWAHCWTLVVLCASFIAEKGVLCRKKARNCQAKLTFPHEKNHILHGILTKISFKYAQHVRWDQSQQQQKQGQHRKNNKSVQMVFCPSRQGFISIGVVSIVIIFAIKSDNKIDWRYFLLSHIKWKACLSFLLRFAWWRSSSPICLFLSCEISRFWEILKGKYAYFCFPNTFCYELWSSGFTVWATVYRTSTETSMLVLTDQKLSE